MAPDKCHGRCYDFRYRYFRLLWQFHGSGRKSGTTTSSRDALFAGYTPYYTCAVWGGYDDNAMQKGSDTNYPKRIWKAVMKRIHENLAYKDFTKPSGIVAVAVCKESGKLPIEGVCDHDPRGNCVITEYFAQGYRTNRILRSSYCSQYLYRI